MGLVDESAEPILQYTVFTCGTCVIFLMQSIYQVACMGSLAEMLTNFVIVYIEQTDHSLLK